MGLIYGKNGLEETKPNKSSYYHLNNIPLKNVCFKADIYQEEQIKTLIKKKLIYGFSEFVRFAFKNQLKKGYNTFLAIDIQTFNDSLSTMPKVCRTVKFPDQLRALAKTFCEKHHLNFSQYTRYTISEELKDWSEHL